jgi:RNA polymerase sigma-70 factor (ECF subfamily)
VTRLRAGDEAAFAELVDDLNARLLAVARTFTSSPALAEDIVQETWLAVIRGLAAFEGRSSLRTWVYSILIRRARTLAVREARRRDAAVPAEESPERPNVEWEPGRGRVGLWEESPRAWRIEDPAALLQGRETLELVGLALAGLPESQRRVVLLRDVEELSTAEVCNILQLKETNMRVLLHRGRARIRRALDRYMRDGARPETPTLPDGRTSPTRPRSAMAEGAAGLARATGGPRGTSGSSG